MAVLKQRASHKSGGVVYALILVAATALAEEPHSEYEVKAACLYNFAKFVEWPAGAFAEPDAPVVIGLYGVDPFGRLLDETVKGRKVNNRAVIVKRFVRVQDIGDCHILFVSRSENMRLSGILGRRSLAGVLTVGESDDFISLGGIINFTIKDGKVRFQVSQRAADRAGLKISSQMLKLSIEVGPEQITEQRNEAD